MWTRHFALASIMICAINSACSEKPSFELRWAIVTDVSEQPSPLTSVVQCSSVGISTVQVLTTHQDALIDTRTFPCFPSEFADLETTIAGPELDAGNYFVTVTPLGRNGSSWADRSAYKQEIVIQAKQQEPLLLDKVMLVAPKPCEDGIDNDKDGLVDQTDPGCRVGVNEEDDIRITHFRFRTTLLNENPHATCLGVGLAHVRIVIDEDQDNAMEVGCSTKKTELFIRQLDPGAHTVTVMGLNSEGMEITSPQVTPFMVTESQGDFIDVVADFSADEFLTPIQGEIQFSLAYQIADDPAEVRTCIPTARQGLLELDKVRIRILDGEGKPIDPPVQLTTGELLDDSPLDCPAGVFVTEELIWGSYQIAVEALSPTNEVCFSNQATPALAAPSSAFTVVVGRVSSENSCQDCQSSTDCSCLDCCSEQNICLP